MEHNEKSMPSSPNKQSGNSSSLMYLFLLGFAIITLLGACSLNDDTTKTVGSETWETTESNEILPEFLSVHTELTSGLYSHVHEHASTMEMLDCYCGCMEENEIDETHTSLLRCYWAEHPADDGAVTWTDHSTTCGVCKDELQMVIDLSNKGSTPEEIKAEIKAKYSPDS